MYEKDYLYKITGITGKWRVTLFTNERIAIDNIRQCHPGDTFELATTLLPQTPPK